MGKIFKGDVGTEIIINMQRDISTATDISIKVLTPNKTQTTWTPTIYNTNYLRYIIVSGDLSENGTYTLQPVLTLGSWVGSGTPVSFYVSKVVY